jgi:single-stranded DNA-binding protein
MGSVKKHPEVKTTDKGTLFGKCILEAKDPTDKNGQWIHIQGFGKSAEAMNGVYENDVLIVEGKFETRKYKDKAGQDRTFSYVAANKVVKFNGDSASTTQSSEDDIGF